MLLMPGSGDMRVISNMGLVGTTAPGVAVPEGAAVDTYGATTEVLSAAANTQDSWGIHITLTAITAPAAAIAHGVVDILLGTATEDVLVSSLIVGGSYITSRRSFFFPVRIPSGTRIAARFASGMAHATDAEVGIYLYGGCPSPFRTGRKVTTYGTKVGPARGVALTVAASGAAATATQITAATTDDHFYFLPGFQAETDSSVTPNTFVNVGIGVGAATEERIGTWWFSKTTEERQSGPWPDWGVWRDVPAGQRLTLLCSNGGNNDAAYGGLIYAVS